MRYPLLVLAALVPLAACGSNDGAGTTISINSTDSDGNVTAKADGASGTVSVDVPGFSGALKLPKIHLDASNFDMNGVHLYPGSTISNMSVDAHGDNNGVVTVDFDSPAAPATVRDWFNDKLTAADFTLRADGDSLVGTNEDGKPFRLDLTPAGTGHAAGKITISG
ncbi:MAG TPA: hypothetical protein VM657_11930 [Sphingomonas sp.]|nr:hypothetical protein [Sphingomonas sp.]